MTNISEKMNKYTTTTWKSQGINYINIRFNEFYQTVTGTQDCTNSNC